MSLVDDIKMALSSPHIPEETARALLLEVLDDMDKLNWVSYTNHNTAQTMCYATKGHLDAIAISVALSSYYGGDNAPE